MSNKKKCPYIYIESDDHLIRLMKSIYKNGMDYCCLDLFECLHEVEISINKFTIVFLSESDGILFSSKKGEKYAIQHRVRANSIDHFVAMARPLFHNHEYEALDEFDEVD